jgi:hypothetical protein
VLRNPHRQDMYKLYLIFSVKLSDARHIGHARSQNSIFVADKALGMTMGNSDSNRVATRESLTKPPVVKRNRIQLSCTHCRQAKLKCDRERPCLQCVKRGRSSICMFLPPVARKKPMVSMQSRLNHLESVIKDAMASQLSRQSVDDSVSPGDNLDSALPNLAQKPHGDVDTSTSDVSDPPGRVFLGPNDATFVGATHWAAILDSVRLLTLSPQLTWLDWYSFRLRK